MDGLQFISKNSDLYLMFQSFEVKIEPENAGPRIERLRTEMARVGLDGFLVPREDEHQGAYVPPSSQRLMWLTGFSGSAGVVLVLKDKAIIFIDGRYMLQVRQQTDLAVFSYENLSAIPPATWLEQHGTGLKIGFDACLHTISEVLSLRKALDRVGGYLVEVEKNLVDIIWNRHPNIPFGQVTLQPVELTGRTAQEKFAEIQKAITAEGASATILTDPSSVAWCFNIRGTDVANTPLPLSFAIISVRDRPQLFIDQHKLGKNEESYLQNLCNILEPVEFEENIRQLAQSGDVILLDPSLTAENLRLVVEKAGGKIREGIDPVQLPRAVKTQAELAGARKAHKRDGAALVRFFAWLADQRPGTQDEISTTQKLEELRSQTAETENSKLEDISFDTISGAGPHGAIIHYRVNTQTNRPLMNGELYLIDSGAQYRDGTTDVTRTVAIGDVGEEKKRCFTLVLKGMIAISIARFPVGTSGQDIDVLARIALWKNGFDYAHGTGHGVGSFLSVHEGPQILSRTGKQKLLPGMILSNEPGYYRESAFGIRIENLLVVQVPEIPDGGDLPMLGFETLTLCPVDRNLILPELLDREERDWLNSYHDTVYRKLAPMLNEAERDWLAWATAPLEVLFVP
ncbi:MAG: Xaa-Pro aminopeptidase [Candidatus Tokpelaia sp. JSC189]|nr:MAG: Xaa-Pro aminopeptidase [Candidatus Tokpelaia sp. JSC189]